jgi:hypothetical protein
VTYFFNSFCVTMCLESGKSVMIGAAALRSRIESSELPDGGMTKRILLAT